MLRDLKNRRAFQKAQASAAENEMVCGTIAEDGTPIYFTMPKDASESAVREESFLRRHGRPMSDFERQMYDLAAGRVDA